MVNTDLIVYIRRITMMGEYGGLTSGNDFAISLKQFLTTLMNFFQTPGGWAFIAVVIILFFVFKR